MSKQKDENKFLTKANITIACSVVGFLTTLCVFGTKIYDSYVTSKYMHQIDCAVDILAVVMCIVFAVSDVVERKQRKEGDSSIIESIPEQITKELDYKLAEIKPIVNFLKDIHVYNAVSSGHGEAMRILKKYGLD